MVKIIHVTPAQVLAAQTLLRRQATNRETLRKIANAQPSETNMDYDTEKDVLEHALERRTVEARDALHELETDRLDAFLNALDWIAAEADAEAIKRAEKRR